MDSQACKNNISNYQPVLYARFECNDFRLIYADFLHFFVIAKKILYLHVNYASMTAEFQWLAEGVMLPDLDFAKLEQWIAQVATSHNRIVRSINYVFCDDETILRVNREFLNHDYFTDIITFDSCTGRLLRGDIYLSLDTVRSNAEMLGQPYDRELMRVIIHGVLHLCGINDKGPGERKVMEAAENEALALLFN